MRRGRERHAGDAVQRLADSLAPQTPEALVARAWSTVVGPALAAHSRPVSVKGSTLTVQCGASVYAQELEFQSKRILEALSRELGGNLIERIRFVTASTR
jgi:predicted nucleic acid-binding Zn ribbon protein